MEAIQEILGAHQDSVLIRAELHQLAVAAHHNGENAFTYGRLHALEQTRADTTAHDYIAAYQHAKSRTLHHWLKG
jgi:hypothetical protein